VLLKEKTREMTKYDTEQLLPAAGGGMVKADVTELLAGLDRDGLLAVFRVLIEDNPLLKGAIALVLKERRNLEKLRHDQVRQLDLNGALEFYGQEIPRVIRECEALFCETENCGDDWDDSEPEWDFSAGLQRLQRYGHELLGMVTEQHYISGTVGLLLTMPAVEDWQNKYGSEYEQGELVDGCGDFHSLLCEALEQVKEYRAADPQAEVFLSALMDWMLSQCEEPADLTNWAWLLTDCVADLKGFRYLEESVRRLDRDFLHSSRLNDGERHFLVHWWVESCLKYDLEKEAVLAAAALPGDERICKLLVRYYQNKGRWQEALAALEEIIRDKAGRSEYEWMVSLCRKAGDPEKEKMWLEMSIFIPAGICRKAAPRY
jgi:hypothetical protein